jgi:hypothetical protein
MAHFAKVNQQRIVTQVIVAEEEHIENLPGNWIQTSYNTYGGVHLLGGTPLRKNYAGVGYTYDYVREAFIPPQPFESWTLNEDSCLWEAPATKPEGNYYWDEPTLSWKEWIQN